MQDSDDYSDNEHDNKDDLTLAVLAFGLYAVNDEQGCRHCHEQFYECRNDMQPHLKKHRYYIK